MAAPPDPKFFNSNPALINEGDLYPSAQPLGLLQVPRSGANFTICYCKPDPGVAERLARSVNYTAGSLEWATVRAGPMNQRAANTFALAQNTLELFGLPAIRHLVVQLNPDPSRWLQCPALPEHGRGYTSCTRTDMMERFDYFVLMECLHTAAAGYPITSCFPMKPHVNSSQRKKWGRKPRGYLTTWEALKTMVVDHQSLANYVPQFSFTNEKIYPYMMVKVVIARYVLGLTNMTEDNFIVVRRSKQRQLQQHAAALLSKKAASALMQLYDIYNVGTYNLYREGGESVGLNAYISTMTKYSAVRRSWINYMDYLLADIRNWIEIVRSKRFELLLMNTPCYGNSAGEHDRHYTSWQSFRQEVEAKMVQITVSPMAFMPVAARKMRHHSQVIRRRLGSTSKNDGDADGDDEDWKLASEEEEEERKATKNSGKSKVNVIRLESDKETAAVVPSPPSPRPPPLLLESPPVVAVTPPTASAATTASNTKKRTRSLPAIDAELLAPRSKRLCLRSMDEIEDFDGTTWLLPLFPQVPLPSLPVYG